MTSLSPETRKKITELTGKYPQKQAALLPVLHLIQNEIGYIPAEAEIWVAELLGLQPVRVKEVITFYTMFLEKPIGRYHLQVCTNLSCTLAGARNILSYLMNKLGIKPGETTADGRFTLTTVECLGACEHAPCMMVNFDYYEHLTPEKIDKILDGLE
ncbi:NADH-quinone oxidoreductase subunit NuoE [Candidatus Aminicenantes bacterium AC-334-K16]|jgi:NADH-quinone oxidoreductase subunit E|nr:NADH-quinone oxidoreductase subunit NuoE [Candidatus Aminicenantes bacterium AC-334-K16]